MLSAFREKFSEKHPKLAAFLAQDVKTAFTRHPAAMSQGCVLSLYFALNPGLALLHGLAIYAGTEFIGPYFEDRTMRHLNGASLYKGMKWRLAHSMRKDLLYGSPEVKTLTDALAYAQAAGLASYHIQDELFESAYHKPYIYTDTPSLTEEVKFALDAHFRHDPLLEQNRPLWEKMTEAQRLDVLKTTISTLCGIYGIDMPEVVFKNEPDEHAYYNHTKKRIVFSTAEDGLWDDFDTTIAAALHEATHHWQDSLISDWENGALAEDDPRIPEIMLWAINNTRYFSADESRNRYTLQPTEVHAKIVENIANGIFEERQIKEITAFLDQISQKFETEDNMPPPAAPSKDI